MGNNSASADTVEPAADLSISKSALPDPVAVDGVLTYTLVAANHGPSGATVVTVVDTLSTEVEFLSAGATQGTVGEAGGVVTASLGGLPADASATVTIGVRPLAPGSRAQPEPVGGCQRGWCHGIGIRPAAGQQHLCGPDDRGRRLAAWRDDTFDTGASRRRARRPAGAPSGSRQRAGLARLRSSGGATAAMWRRATATTASAA